MTSALSSSGPRDMMAMLRLIRVALPCSSGLRCGLYGYWGIKCVMIQFHTKITTRTHSSISTTMS